MQVQLLSGARHELCAVVCDIAPSKRSPVLSNYFGSDLHTYLVKKLDDAWKVKHNKSEVSSLELAAATAKYSDSDSDSDEVPSFGGLVLQQA